MNESIYPLKFRTDVRGRVWGGRRLGEVLNKTLPADVPIGESWEVYGGSVVSEGPHTNKTVDELRTELGEALMGIGVRTGPDDAFPLLFKYIDAADVLSVQVHPDDLYATEREHYPYGKTEAWYVISADPGAQLVHGWKRPTTREEVEQAVADNRLEELLNYVDVEPGDVIHVPARTVHAIGGGILLGEIQENSDITYRLYDWGRVGLDGKPRELHVGPSLDVLEYGLTESHKQAGLETSQDGITFKHLVECGYFVMNSIEGSEDFGVVATDSSFKLLSSLNSSVEIEWTSGTTRLEKGETALLPAALGAWRVHATQPYKLLYMYVPESRLADPTRAVEPNANTMRAIMPL